MPPRLLPRQLACCLLLTTVGVAAALAAPPAASRRTPPAVAPARPLVVGYLPQWGLYSTPPWLVRDLVTSGAAPLLDQVNYAQGTVRDGRCVIADPNADLNRAYTAAMSVDDRDDMPTAPLRGALHQLQLLRQRYPRIRVLISLEGKGSEFANAAQPATREAFVTSCMDMFLRGHLAPGIEAPALFDGIDLDWEFPQSPEDGANYTALVAEFRRQLDAWQPTRPKHPDAAGRPVLTLAVGPGTGRYPGVDWPRVAALVDEVGLMNYDYNGPWQQQTGMLAPLYTIDGDPRPQNTVDATVQEYEAVGIPASKLLLGVPFYGYHWQAVAATNHGLFQPGQSVRDDAPYHAIAALQAQTTLYRDAHSQTPWLYDGQTFWTFDDPASSRAKAAYASLHGLGGVMVWELSGDTADAQLLRAIDAGLRSSRGTVAQAPAPAVPLTPVSP